MQMILLDRADKLLRGGGEAGEPMPSRVVRCALQIPRGWLSSTTVCVKQTVQHYGHAWCSQDV